MLKRLSYGSFSKHLLKLQVYIHLGYFLIFLAQRGE